MYKENEARNRVHPNHLSYNQCLDKLDMKAMRFFTTKDELSARNIEGTLQSALHEHLNPVHPAPLKNSSMAVGRLWKNPDMGKRDGFGCYTVFITYSFLVAKCPDIIALPPGKVQKMQTVVPNKKQKLVTPVELIGKTIVITGSLGLGVTRGNAEAALKALPNTTYRSNMPVITESNKGEIIVVLGKQSKTKGERLSNGGKRQVAADEKLYCMEAEVFVKLIKPIVG